MPRHRQFRRIRGKYPTGLFGRLSDSDNATPDFVLGADELEAIRLKDVEGLDQETAAEKMGVSRATFQRILNDARKKIALALINDAVLFVHAEKPFYIHCRTCGSHYYSISGIKGNRCPGCGSRLKNHIKIKGGKKMKVAFSSSNGKTISAHFGRSRYFVVLEIEDGKIVNREVRENPHASEPHEHGGHHQHQHHHHHHHHHLWMEETLGDCDVIITRGLGHGAYQNLIELGKEVYVVEEKEMEKALKDLGLIS